MWRNKKSVVVAVLVALPVIALMLVGGGCTQATDSNTGETGTVPTEGSANIQPQMPQEGIRSPIPWDEVAEILGVDKQELEDAFAQARDELGDDAFPAFPERELVPGEQPPDEQPPDVSPPEGWSDRTGPPGGMRLPEALLAKMAEILEIDQQALEDAIAQAQSDVFEQAPE